MIKLHDYLDYPDNWNEETARTVNNGCGTAGWKGALIPDSIYLVSIKAACLIHDFDYYWGTTAKDKKNADYRFLVNMKALIKHESRPWSKWLNTNRRLRAHIYYESVRKFGNAAFFDGKTGA